ncbi:MAG: hypothetical protein KatS3mg084_0283 [Candidatus Dojkabacteria bacterium]|nr:MAG: hypothetical protein KatS3mg084_0283 [Candidatus Dojkabacteria bacterium]
MNTQVNPQNVVSVNHNLPQHYPAGPSAMGVNVQPTVGSVSGSAPQAVYGVPQNKAGSKNKSCFLISGIVLFVVCCVCTVFLSVLVNGNVTAVEQHKKIIVSELDKTVCEKSDSDLSRVYRTKTLEEFRQSTTEADFVKQAKKISGICNHLEGKSAIDLYSQGIILGIEGVSPYDTGVNKMALVVSNYNGDGVSIVMVGNTQEGFKIKNFVIAEVASK